MTLARAHMRRQQYKAEEVQGENKDNGNDDDEDESKSGNTWVKEDNDVVNKGINVSVVVARVMVQFKDVQGKYNNEVYVCFVSCFG